MKKLLLYFFIVMSGTMTATTIKNRDAGPTAVATTVVNPSCGASDGSVTIGAVTGGVAPYTYNFNNLGYSGITNYTGLFPGTYPLEVKDSNGDIYNTSVTVIDTPGPTSIATTIVNATCGASNGSVTITGVTGGTAPYQYSFNFGGTYSTVTTYINLTAGAYSLEVKDANGCIFTTAVTILDAPGPTNIATTIVDATCGTNDGSITINGVTGGVAPYTYSYNGSAFTASTAYPNLPGSTASLIVKDANGCIYNNIITINEISSITAVDLITTSPSSCGALDGAVTINGVTGGVAPYTYSFDNMGFSTQTSYTNLWEGSHPLIIKDVNGCIYNTFAFIAPASNSILSVATTVVNTSSCGGSDGSVTIDNVMGGVAPYVYSLDWIPYQSSNMFYTLSPGSYSLSVKDVNGCEYNTTVTVFATDDRSVTINYPDSPYSISLTAPQPVTITGTGSYTGGTFSATGGGGLLINSTTGTITPFGSVPGTHTVVYTLPGNTICPTITTTAIVTISNIPILELSMTGVYSDYNADGFVNLGDVINYQFTVTNNGSSNITNIEISNFNMTTTGSLSVLATGTSDSTTFTAVHVITQADINNGSVTVDAQATGAYNSTNVADVATTNTPLNTSDGIKLNAFFDTNGNGVQNAGENNYYAGEFHYELNNDGTIHNVSSSYNAHTIYETNATNSYDVSFTTNNPNYTVSPSSYANITVANGSGITTYNFPVTGIPYTDLRVTLSPNGGPRPGFTYGNSIYVKNNGTQPTPAGTLTFTNDSKLTIASVSSAVTMTATGFTYNYPILAPNNWIYIYVQLQVPTIPTVQLGNFMTNTASIDIPAGDVNLSNNNMSLTQDVRGSYDPNDKNESHGPEIVHSTFTSTDYLNYTIQFENTGTANAITVKVDDALDTKLDETSIKMINASHNYTLDRVGNNLTWTFSGIDLPPSVAGTTIGHGYINFQVKPKPGYTIGDIINNTAYIYFDFNPAIVTNTFSTEFVTALGVEGFVNSQFSAYPNPTKGIINIALKNNAAVIDMITVTDILGKKVQSNSVNSANTTVDLSNLTKGLYFVKIQAEGMVKTLKVLKE